MSASLAGLCDRLCGDMTGRSKLALEMNKILSPVFIHDNASQCLIVTLWMSCIGCGSKAL